MDEAKAGGRRLLWPALLLSGLGYIALAVVFPLGRNLARIPTADIFSLTGSLAGGLVYAAVLVLLFALLVVAFRALWRGDAGAISQRGPWVTLAMILGVATVFGLPLVFTYPINATDVFRYGHSGHITSVYGGNPYVEPLTNYPEDPLRPYAGEWAGETAPYGPVWEGAAGLLGLVAPRSAYGTLLAFKGLGLLLLLATSVVLWQLLAPLPLAPRAAFVGLWAWNPALLLTFVANGHNDALMLLWLLLGLLALRRGRPVLGMSLMVVACLTKPIALLVLPIFLVGELRRQPSTAQRAWTVLGAAVAGAILVGLAFLPWAGRGGWVAAPLALGARLAREASAGAGFSPAVFFYFLSQALGLNVSIELIGNILLAAFALLYAVIVWRVWRGRSAVLGAAAAFAGYLLQALNFRIWYAAWPFPFLIVDAAVGERADDQSAPYWLRAGFWFLLTTQLSVVIYGHVRIFLLAGSHPWAHLVGVPFVFLLPLVLARWSWLPAAQPTDATPSQS